MSGSGEVKVTLDLPSLALDPARIDDVSPEAVPEPLGELEVIRARLMARLLLPQLSQPAEAAARLQQECDHLLKAAEAAEILGVDDRWLYRNASTLPFTRRLSPGTVRFSECGLRRWVETCK